MVFKRCGEKGCATSPKCGHPWHIKITVDGDLERGGAQKYAFLLKGTKRSLPRTETEAEMLESDVRKWVIDGRPKAIAAAVAKLTVTEMVDNYRTKFAEKELKCSATPSMLRWVATEYGPKPAIELYARATIQEIKDELAEDRSTGTVNGYLKRISHMLNWSRGEYGLKLDSPFYHRTLNPLGVKYFPKGDGRSRRLTPIEEAKLLAAFAKLDAGTARHKDGGMMEGRFYAAVDGCMRRGEMLQIRKEQVLWNEEAKTGKLRIRLDWTTTKGKKTRLVPVTTKRLRAFLLSRKLVTYPFGTIDGKPLAAFREDWESALLISGLEAGHYEQRDCGSTWITTLDADLHWHDLRYEGASRLAEKGVPIAEISKLLGHADIKTTQTYLNMTDDHLDESMARAQAGL